MGYKIPSLIYWISNMLYKISYISYQIPYLNNLDFFVFWYTRYLNLHTIYLNYI